MELNVKPTAKKCGHCKEVKALTEFWTQTNKENGKEYKTYRSVCKMCSMKYTASHKFIKQAPKMLRSIADRLESKQEYLDSVMHKNRDRTL